MFKNFILLVLAIVCSSELFATQKTNISYFDISRSWNLKIDLELYLKHIHRSSIFASSLIYLHLDEINDVEKISISIELFKQCLCVPTDSDCSIIRVDIQNLIQTILSKKNNRSSDIENDECTNKEEQIELSSTEWISLIQDLVTFNLKSEEENGFYCFNRKMLMFVLLSRTKLDLSFVKDLLSSIEGGNDNNEKNNSSSGEGLQTSSQDHMIID